MYFSAFRSRRPPPGQQDDSASRTLEAIHGLERRHPGFSARRRLTYWQMLLLALVTGFFLTSLLLQPRSTLYVTGGLLNLLFVWAILLRFYALVTLSAPENKRDPVTTPGDDALPVYTILAPLFHEERVVGPLIRHLQQLDYPPERLDIKLIMEEDDRATLLAARAAAPPPQFEIVLLPPSQPRTKPKAINYALQQARGEFTVVYDAEDRPQTDQLKKAVGRFRQTNDRLICLQARLNFYNPRDNWLTRQFTIEYTSLFDGLLPALQRLELPILLGGTSNHFRTRELRRLGGWDAFNVTEDADLGIRMHRFGYRCEVLASTTYEEACGRPVDWIRQRTRWLKGWLQTWFVHMRRPLLLIRQMGVGGFVGFQLALGAQIAALIAHPVYIVFIVEEALTGQLWRQPAGFFGHALLALAGFNLLFGYISAMLLAARTLRRRRLGLVADTLMMPFYWLLISAATLRAIAHFAFKPFHWEKTEHGLAKSDTGPPQ